MKQACWVAYRGIQARPLGGSHAEQAMCWACADWAWAWPGLHGSSGLLLWAKWALGGIGPNSWALSPTKRLKEIKATQYDKYDK